jgi:hypothetical protein
MKLQDITTIDQIKALKGEEVAASVHIIIGPNGMCMCGCYDGHSLSCGQILTIIAKVEDAELLSSRKERN